MKDNEKARFSLRQIIKALTWWNEGGWKTSSAVGAIIQQKAQKLLGIKADMSALKTEAESQLKQNRLHEQVAAYARQVEREMMQQSMFLKPQLLMPGPGQLFNFSFTKPKKTRREELEGYSNGQIETIFKEKQAKEIKKDRINYILESEKEYK